MSYLEVILQAILQGFTEFLPISSSGHLSVAQYFMGTESESRVMFILVVHIGTLIAVFAAFRKLIIKLIAETGRLIRDLVTLKFSFENMNPERNMIFMLVLALIPLALFYPFRDFFKGLAEDSDITVEGICFLFTALLLFLADKCVKGRRRIGDINYRNALTIGVFQSIALLPGVSRSGSTISAGLFCGLTKETAVKFSFILGIPAIIAGTLSEAGDLSAASESIGGMKIILALAVSAAAGFLAIKAVTWLIKSNKFFIFAIYLAILGIGVIISGIVGKII
ncbi:MAG: undecaprenyl-diphosphate phosphatase [Oscillospiraceae bacterium]|nr:undecaprenyl-diphosphate phosphatase [Oscillospiraceae bacterium]